MSKAKSTEADGRDGRMRGGGLRRLSAVGVCRDGCAGRLIHPTVSRDILVGGVLCTATISPMIRATCLVSFAVFWRCSAAPDGWAGAVAVGKEDGRRELYRVGVGEVERVVEAAAFASALGRLDDQVRDLDEVAKLQ